MSFVPRFTYSNSLVRHLGVIEGARAVIEVLPLPPDTTLRLRHDALQRSTRSSTQIEGNPLDEAAAPEAPPWERLARTSQQLLTRLLARVLDGVESPFTINPTDIESWFGVSDRTAREWLKDWAKDCFIIPVLTGSGARIRSYELAPEWIETCFKIRTSVSGNSGS